LVQQCFSGKIIHAALPRTCGFSPSSDARFCPLSYHPAPLVRVRRSHSRLALVKPTLYAPLFFWTQGQFCRASAHLFPDQFDVLRRAFHEHFGPCQFSHVDVVPSRFARLWAPLLSPSASLFRPGTLFLMWYYRIHVSCFSFFSKTSACRFSRDFVLRSSLSPALPLFLAAKFSTTRPSDWDCIMSSKCHLFPSPTSLSLQRRSPKFFLSGRQEAVFFPL